MSTESRDRIFTQRRPGVGRTRGEGRIMRALRGHREPEQTPRKTCAKNYKVVR